jgi:hypothetical protein
MEKISNAKAVKEFFEADGGAPVKMPELSTAKRSELGQLCAEALGKEIG